MKQKLQLGTLFLANLAALYYLCLAIWDFFTASILDYENEAMKREFVVYNCGWSLGLSAIVALTGLLLNWLFLRLIFGRGQGRLARRVASIAALSSFGVLAFVVAFGTKYLYQNPLGS